MTSVHVHAPGERFGRLTVLERAGSQLGEARWRCLCDCGAEVVTLGRHLRNGKTRSCGCIRADLNRAGRRRRDEKATALADGASMDRQLSG